MKKKMKKKISKKLISQFGITFKLKKMNFFFNLNTQEANRRRKMSSNFQEDWKAFKRNPSSIPLVYVSTVDPWEDVETCQTIILEILSKYGLFSPGPEEIKKIFKYDYLQVWKQAFTTHYKIDVEQWKKYKRVKSETNYEALEYLGDSSMNQIASQYLYYRFPDLFKTNLYFPRLVFRMDSYIHSDKMWRDYEVVLNLKRLIRYDIFDYSSTPRHQTSSKKELINEEEFMADIVEAFFGATSLILNKLYVGLGHAVCTNMLYTYLNRIDIPTDLIFYVDYTSMFNDIHGSKKLPVDILHSEKGNFKGSKNWSISLLILEKNSTTKELKTDFMNQPHLYESEPGYKYFWSTESRKELFEQVMLYLKVEYNIEWTA
jgi:dsRNA-specific ribonuclease